MGEPEPTRLGRYELLGLLATGGMAEIHLARQTGIHGFERIVVVKRVLPGLARDPKILELFLDEARIAAQLSHPNVVQIFDLGQEGDQLFIAMEYLEGESLGTLARAGLAAGRPITAGLAAGIAAQICDGLQYAHTLCDPAGQPLQIVHRDVSPQNVVVQPSGIVKLVDFGIAKAASQAHRTQVGALKGKLSYVSPEQCRAQPVDARSDLFSLGVVLWELLTHRRLFRRDSEAGTIAAVAFEPIPSARSVRPDVPEELDAIVRRALERDPSRRYQQAAQLATALRAWLRREAIDAAAPDVAAYVADVLGDRARTKQRVLETLRASGARHEAALEVLRPGTGESLPSRSETLPEVEAGPTGPPGQAAGGSAAGSRGSTGRRRALAALGVLGVAAAAVAALRLAGGDDALAWGRANPSAVSEAPGPDPGTAARAEPEPQPGPAAGGVAGAAARAAPEPGPAPGSGAGAAGPAGGAAPSPPAVAAPAVVAIRSRPAGCAVRIDGEALDERTPVEAAELDALRQHELTVECPGHDPETRTVALGAGQRLGLDFAPRKAPAARAKAGTLRLDSEPWSEVFLGSRKLGITPLLGVKLPPGDHRLTLVNAEGGIRKTVLVTIQPGRTTTHHEVLGR